MGAWFVKTSKALTTKYGCHFSIARIQPNISCLAELYLGSLSFNLFFFFPHPVEKYSTGCQTFPCYNSKTAPTVVPDASNLNHTDNSESYTLRTWADVKANFSASKAACYLAPNLKDFLPGKIPVRGAATLANLKQTGDNNSPNQENTITHLY